VVLWPAIRLTGLTYLMGVSVVAVRQEVWHSDQLYSISLTGLTYLMGVSVVAVRQEVWYSDKLYKAHRVDLPNGRVCGSSQAGGVVL
jgi:hypothetical protein